MILCFADSFILWIGACLPRISAKFDRDNLDFAGLCFLNNKEIFYNLVSLKRTYLQNGLSSPCTSNVFIQEVCRFSWGSFGSLTISLEMTVLFGRDISFEVSCLTNSIMCRLFVFLWCQFFSVHFRLQLQGGWMGCANNLFLFDF